LNTIGAIQFNAMEPKAAKVRSAPTGASQQLAIC
jgi:hypothetical protein